MRGAELLGRADVVVYDALVNADLLRLARADASIVYAGKRAREHALSQEALNRLLVAEAKMGKCVVRLKGGDPYVFGRGGEEALELARAGVPFEVVPGITSIVAGPNYAGIPLTHRAHCSSFTVLTGHEDPEKTQSWLDWAAVARVPGTKIILMGMERLAGIAEALVGHGMAPETPAAVVQWATTGRQRTVAGTLADIAGRAEAAGLGAPSVAIFGGVVELRGELNWFEKRALFGKRVVVTRTREQASQLAARLSELGAEVLELPTIRIEPPKQKKHLKDAMLELGSYDWLVFTSPNGVSSFFRYLLAGFEDIRALGNVRIAAVGPATAAKLKELHLRVDVMPEAYVSARIARALQAYQRLDNLKVLLLRAEVANSELPKKLEDLGAIVDDVACYRTVAETEDRNGAAAQLLDLGADWITFTSSSTVEHLHARVNLPALLKAHPGIRLASIGPETSAAIAALGLTPPVEANPHTIDGLVAAICGTCASAGSGTSPQSPTQY
jgi:uroporphyrinogen III methyltransferase/synthase